MTGHYYFCHKGRKYKSSIKCQTNRITKFSCYQLLTKTCNWVFSFANPKSRGPFRLKLATVFLSNALSVFKLISLDNANLWKEIKRSFMLVVYLALLMKFKCKAYKMFLVRPIISAVCKADTYAHVGSRGIFELTLARLHKISYLLVIVGI